MRNGMKKWIRKTEGKKDDYIPTSEGAGGWVGARDGKLAYLHSYWRGHICWDSVLACARWENLSFEERSDWYECLGQNFRGNAIAGEMGVHDGDRYWDRKAGESVSWDTLRKRQDRRSSASLSSSPRASAEHILEGQFPAEW